MNPQEPLTWALFAFLGTGALFVFGGSWKLFNILKDIQDNINNDREQDKKEIYNALTRIESTTKETTDVLHSRQNKATEEIGEVEAKVEYQRGVTDTMKDFMLTGKIKHD